MKRAIRFNRVFSLSLAVAIGLAAVLLSFGLFGMTSVVLAQGREQPETVNLEPFLQPELQIYAVVVFTDPAVILVHDLAGNVIGEGIHTGEVRCKGDNCNRKTQLDFRPGSGLYRYEYQFKSLQAFDPEARRLIVAGRGSIYNGPARERFLFTATFEDNQDGTVAVTYEASRPDASFLIPKAPGTLAFTSRP